MKRKVTLVNYINTYPFIEALLPAMNQYDIIKKNPRQCALDFQAGVTDFALVPTGFLPSLDKNYTLVDTFGIAGDGVIDTVRLMSKVPLSEIKNIILDDHSTTSVLLLKILIHTYWNLDVNFITETIDPSENYESVLMIGDKVFAHKDKYAYSYDLGEAWKGFTGLPFVYAIWLAKKAISDDEIRSFTIHLDRGTQDLDSVIQKYTPQFPQLDLKSYLGQRIHHRLSYKYIQGLELFLEKCQSYVSQQESAKAV